MKKALIILGSVAVVLGIIAYFGVFSGSQIIEPSSTASASSSLFGFATSTSSSMDVATGTTTTIAEASSSESGSTTFQTLFNAPYPVAWTEGQPQFAITGASLEGNQLSVILDVKTGSTAQCVPVNMRLITDEQGDMQAPSSPTTQNFPLDGDSDCTGTAGTDYPNQIVTFTVDLTQMPLLLTTGGVANQYFEIATTTNNGLSVSTPQQSG